MIVFGALGTLALLMLAPLPGMPTGTESDQALALVPGEPVRDEHVPLQPDADGLVFSDGTPVRSHDTEVQHHAVTAFVPSHEWKVVPEGASIPAGLHVQIDMQTGEKRAKLMEDRPGIQTFTEKRAAKLNALQDMYNPDNPHARDGMLSDYSSQIQRLKAETQQLRPQAHHLVKTLATALNRTLTDDQRFVGFDAIEALVHEVNDHASADLQRIANASQSCTVWHLSLPQAVRKPPLASMSIPSLTHV
eukprot:m.107963 g.107963  ORF g.107963 m.107963 type:complete len:248 (+) comp15875_c0_seq1:242-985(+)